MIVLRWIRKQSSSGSYINNYIIMKKRRRRQRRRRQHYGGDGNDDDHEMTTSIRASIATLVLIGDFYGPAPVIYRKQSLVFMCGKCLVYHHLSRPSLTHSSLYARPNHVQGGKWDNNDDDVQLLDEYVLSYDYITDGDPVRCVTSRLRRATSPPPPPALLRPRPSRMNYSAGRRVGSCRAWRCRPMRTTTTTTTRRGGR